MRRRATLLCAVLHSLGNLHDTQFRAAFWLPQFRAYTPLLVGLALLWELAFPLAVWSRRARLFILPAGVLFHLGTLVLLNLFFPYHLALYLVFVDWPPAARRLKRRRPFAPRERGGPGGARVGRRIVFDGRARSCTIGGANPTDDLAESGTLRDLRKSS